MLLACAMLGLTACETRPPIRLHPLAAARPRAHPSVRTAAVPSAPRVRTTEEGPQACTSSALEGLSGARKAELFRRFAAEEGQPGGAPAQAGPARGVQQASASCPPSSR